MFFSKSFADRIKNNDQNVKSDLGIPKVEIKEKQKLKSLKERSQDIELLRKSINSEDSQFYKVNKMQLAQENNEETLNQARRSTFIVAKDEVSDNRQQLQQFEVNDKKAHPGFKEDATNMFAYMFVQNSKLKHSSYKDHPKYFAMNSEN